jgi:glucose-1-phosphate adenylyltransferase
MKKKVIAMVLVGGRGSRLGQITKHTAKPAVSFGGKYRLIDFVLSNITNSGIDTVGLITQYEPHDLMQYIQHGSTWDLDVNDGGVSFLTPYTGFEGDVWQKGTAHAIKQHFRYIDQYNPEHVVILSGDHIYKMDYRKMIDEHINNNAEITIATFKVGKDGSRFGILELDDNNKVKSFEEKPDYPKSDLASMGVYVFKKSILQMLLASADDGLFDFGNDIIPYALDHNFNVYGYKFEGYFRDVGTIDALFRANMDLIDNPQYMKLHEYKDFPVYTKSSNLPPHHIMNNSLVRHSMISDGCLISGNLDHCIISSGTVIKSGCKIKNAIIFSKVIVNKGCTIENAIIMDDTVILENTILKFDEVTVVNNDFLWKLGEGHE